MKNVLLLIPTESYRAQDFITGAKSLGINLIIGSQKAQAMHRQMNQRTLIVNMENPERGSEQIQNAATSTKIDAIVSVDDRGLKTAALASEKLGLSHVSLASASLTQNKISMRKALAAAGITQPAMVTYQPGESLEQKIYEIAGFPVVSKPATLSGSIGVIRANSPIELSDAVEMTREIQRYHGCSDELPIIIEKYVPGSEYAVDALITDDSLKPLALFEKPIPLEGPYFAESIYVTPSQLDPETKQRVIDAVDRARRGLAINTGPIHGEIRITDQGEIYLIELAARSIGGRCSRAIPFRGGTNFEELILAEALQIKIPDYSLENQASGVLMIPVPKAGTLRSVSGLDEAKKVPWIVEIDISATIGSDLMPIPYDNKYLGFIFAKAPSFKSAITALERAHALLNLGIS